MDKPKPNKPGTNVVAGPGQPFITAMWDADAGCECGAGAFVAPEVHAPNCSREPVVLGVLVFWAGFHRFEVQVNTGDLGHVERELGDMVAAVKETRERLHVAEDPGQPGT